MARIDVHVHCVPPSYREYCLQNEFAGKGHPDGMPGIPPWDAETHIAMMKEMSITTSILSISSPGTHLTPGDDAEGRRLTRLVNDDLAAICKAHPQHFRFFASLPLPDIEGSLAEIDHIFEQGAVGVQILTNSHGLYPGDPAFAPVWDKLNEKKAIVFFHPTSCYSNGQLVKPQPGIPQPLVEFMFDSTRALTSLLLSSTLQRCPDITIISCHCGGTFPPMVERIAEFSPMLLHKKLTGDQIKEILQKRFYFDLAGMPFPDQIHGLLRLVDKTRLVYGSDFPYTPAPIVSSLAKALDAGNKEIGADLLKNAENLLQDRIS